MRCFLLFFLFSVFCLAPFNFSNEPGDSLGIISSRFSVLVSGFITGHDEDVLESFFEGYSSYNGTQYSGRTYIHSSTSIANSLSFASENDYDLVIRSYTGLLQAIALADNFPEIQIIMPSGSNSFIESFSGDIINCPVIVTGAGIEHNVTGYTLEFFSIDPIGNNLSSFSNGYIAGQLAFLADFLGLSYEEARMLARNTASMQGEFDYFDGFGSINIDEAINWIEQAIKNKSSLLLLRFSDPLVNSLKNDPRYRVFQQKIFDSDLGSLDSKTKKALLDKNTIAAYSAMLLKHINEKRPYLDAGLSLRSLADQIDIHPNQLSWLLNESLGKNFNEFINHFRIQTFKTLSQDPKNSNLTIMGLAYDSGFNSKTVFNTYFKKETGLTPKQYLKQEKN